MQEQTKTILLSSLWKVFPDEMLPTDRYTEFSMLKNEKASFQLAFSASAGQAFQMDISSELAPFIKTYFVENIPAGTTIPKPPKRPDDYYLDGNKSEYPELLRPILNQTITAKYNGVNTVWFEIDASCNTLPIGKKELVLRLLQNDTEVSVEKIMVEVIDAALPKQDFIFTNWFHSDCLMSYYGFEAFSDEYWRVVENYLKRAKEYGMNCVLTPLFTLPLDTKIGGERPTVQLVDVKVTEKNQYAFTFDKLDKWIAMCQRIGIEYFEMSHFFTQWGAKHAPKIVATVNGHEEKIFGWKTRANSKKYKTFIAQFAVAFTKYIDSKNLHEHCLLHVSDEPSGAMIRGYKKASKIVHDNFKGFKIIDALSDFKIYQKGLIETPIPANNHVEKFIGKVPELWTYYCCSQYDKYVSNRFFSMPSQRNRVLGYQLYKFDVKGFLHWGYNFYYLQFSKGLIDPFKLTDAGGSFPSGDAFVVYPAKDGTPIDSLRLHVFYDAFQDKMALELLESLIGKEKVLAILEDGLSSPLTFSDYPHSNQWQLETREKINKAIQENI